MQYYIVPHDIGPWSTWVSILVTRVQNYEIMISDFFSLNICLTEIVVLSLKSEEKWYLPYKTSLWQVQTSSLSTVWNMADHNILNICKWIVGKCQTINFHTTLCRPPPPPTISEKTRNTFSASYITHNIWNMICFMQYHHSGTLK